MTVTQIYELMNTVTKETLGTEGIVAEDLSNVVDIGTAIFNANAVDNYVRKLVDHVGRVIFVNRPYSGGTPSLMRTAWEFGSVMEKITAEIPEATENESWQLEDKTSYDPNIFYSPKVSAKFFNKRVTFEIPMSFTEKQIKESFDNVAQLNGFLSMLYSAVEKSLTVKIDGLMMRTINNMIGETVYSEMPDGTYTGAGGVKAVNLLSRYNTRYGTSITAEEAITTPEFIRFASYEMGVYSSRMARMSTLFNIGGKERFTPPDMLNVVLLSDFAKSADAYLQSDTYHNNFVSLPNAEVVPYWQGSGTNYDFSDISKINITTADNHAITFGGILGIMFDKDCMGVTNLDRRVTTNYNPKAEFYSNWYKFDCGVYSDFNESFVLFYVA